MRKEPGTQGKTGRIARRSGPTPEGAGGPDPGASRVQAGRDMVPVRADNREETAPVPDNREKILSTALGLFTERGFSGTPTSLISKEAGVATGTLFFHFPTKEDLVDTLYRQVKSEAARAMRNGLEKEPAVAGKLRRAGRNAVAWGVANPAKYTFMEQFAHSPFVSTSAHEEGLSHFLFLRDLVKEGIGGGRIRDSDPDLLISMLASSVSGLVATVSAEKDSRKRGKLIDEGLDIIWNGLGA